MNHMTTTYLMTTVRMHITSNVANSTSKYILLPEHANLKCSTFSTCSGRCLSQQHRPFVQHAISPQHAALRSITTTYIITLYFFSPRHALYFISLQCTLANACFINTCSIMPWYALSTCTNTTTYSNITACINDLKISLHCGQKSCLDL